MLPTIFGPSSLFSNRCDKKMERINFLGGCSLLFIALLCIGIGVIVFVHHPPALGQPNIGSPQRGRVLVTAYGCPACHLISRSGPQGLTGPPLTTVGARSFIAGRFPNEPIDMEQWLQHPQQLKPGTLMPDLGVTKRDARDIASYLATLR